MASSQSDAAGTGQVSRTPASPALIVAGFAVIYLVWGSTYLGIRIAIESWPPFLMAGIRFLVAGSLLFVGLRVSGVAKPNRREWLDGALVGTVMLGIGNGSVTWAEKTVASNVAALIISSAPFFIALFEWLRPGGRLPAARTCVGALTGIAGMVWLMTAQGSAESGHSGAISIGSLACLLSVAAWSAGMIYGRYATRPRHVLMAAAQQMLVGSLALLAMSLITGEPNRFTFAAVTGRSWFALVYLSLIGSLLTFSVYNWLLQHTTPARVSTSALVNPVVAIVLGWVFAGETLSPGSMFGALVILAGVALILVPARTDKDAAR